MRANLAEELLIQLMNWTGEQVASERPLLQATANFKLDEYQQFGPGMRYTESLVSWLGQFKNLEERRLAYNFVKENLVFISNNQLTQLINSCYSTQIQPKLLRKTASQLNVEPYQLNVIQASLEYRLNKACSVYIGLSDGARMDYFRRASRASNEQVLLTYAVGGDKTREMAADLESKKQEMEADLESRHSSRHFESLFLLDDFTASGYSTIRKKDGQYRGKVVKTLESLFNPKGSLFQLTQGQPFELHVIFYLATAGALAYLDALLNEFKQEQGFAFEHTVSAIQQLPPSFGITKVSAPQLAALCEKYYDPTLTDRHLEEGGVQDIYLGFHNGGLPLVLSHNTPNNSLPILWSPDDKHFRGLFPRVSRHS